MAHRRSFRGSRGISDAQRRKKSWLAFGVDTSIMVGIAIVVPATGAAPSESLAVLSISSASAGASGLLEGTLMRIRGSVSVPKSTYDQN